jgi:hypothetical protein
MRNIGITQSLKEQREFNRWLSSNPILGSILAIGMLGNGFGWVQFCRPIRSSDGC